MSVKPCSRQPFNRPLIELNYKMSVREFETNKLIFWRGWASERKGQKGFQGQMLMGMEL
jgi:hypothetical protein